MTESQPLTKVPAPAWVLAFFEDIDAKRFGSGFDCFAPDAEMRFGVGHWRGLDEIKAQLKKFDHGMDTKHTVTEFWDGGVVKVVRGEVMMKRHDTGQVVTPAMVHIFYMSLDDPTKARASYGAVGPTEF